MIFRVLGSLELAGADGDLARIPGDKLSTLVAVLLVHANYWVQNTVLIDVLWGEEASKSTRHSLKTYVWQLRQLLMRHTDGSRIEARQGSYRLIVGDGEVDADVFTSAVAVGRAALTAGDAALAKTVLTEALDLWRGEPFDSFGGTTTIAETIRLTELRWSAREALADAMVTLGEDSDAIGLLRGLITEDPLREPLWCRLLVALYRADRRAEAITTFHQARSLLITELGMEPGADLRRIHARILDDRVSTPDRSIAGLRDPADWARGGADVRAGGPAAGA